MLFKTTTQNKQKQTTTKKKLRGNIELDHNFKPTLCTCTCTALNLLESLQFAMLNVSAAIVLLLSHIPLLRQDSCLVRCNSPILRPRT